MTTQVWDTVVMPNYLITLQYDPGTPVVYLVEDVAGPREACAKLVNKVLLYDPGVPVEVTETPVNQNVPVKFSNLGGN